MRNHYHHLSLEDRERIDQMHQEGITISAIHEAIYQYTPNRGKLIECLRRAHRKRQKKEQGLPGSNLESTTDREDV